MGEAERGGGETGRSFDLVTGLEPTVGLSAR